MSSIAISPRVLFDIAGFPITDTTIGMWVAMGLLLAFGVWSARSFGVKPSRIQVVFEGILDFFYDQLVVGFGSKERARAFLPLFFAIMTFLLMANLMTLFPVIFDIGYNGGPLVRQPTSDLTFTLALATVSIVGANALAFKISPLGHLEEFFPLKTILGIRALSDVGNALIRVVLGVINFIGEGARILSLACRLFGNLFAENVMHVVILSLVPYIAPIPFTLIGIFAGVIQAFVFTILTLQFVTLAASSAQKHAEHHHT